MSDRPELTIKLKRKEFLEYYYLKEELVCFCRENGLPTSLLFKNGLDPTVERHMQMRYVRDFFDDNKGASLADAIKCWKYKKSIKGHNKYERSDLRALEQ